MDLITKALIILTGKEKMPYIGELRRIFNEENNCWVLCEYTECGWVEV
jgi:hypothetical protein